MARSPAYDAHPEHVITVTPHPGRVKVRWRGRTVADTTQGLRMEEGRYPPVFYVPLAAVDSALLERTDHATHCPFKGDASYYSLCSDGARDENAVWTYEDPFDQVAAIRDHVAFYPDRVEIEVSGD